MKLRIDSITTPNIWHITDQAPVLEIYADDPFDTSDGQTVLAGSAQRGDLYKRAVLSVAASVVSIPAIVDIDTTEDSLTNQLATYSAYIRATGQELIPWLLNFPLAPINVPGATSVSWTTIRIHAAGVTPRRTNEVYTKQQTDDAIAAAALGGGGGGGSADRGTLAMVAGQAAVASIKTLANSIIHLTGQDAGVTGTLYVSDRNPGVGFTIASTNGADEGDVGWSIFTA